MRVLLSLSLLAAACGGGDSPDPGPGGSCPDLAAGDAGDLPALKAQRCNVPGSMGSANWYRLSATLPDTSIVQVELWPNRGPFRGGAVRAGTFELGADDLDFATCGVCLRAMTDKGLATQREYFATAGTVEVASVAPDADAPFVATVIEASFAEVDADHVELAAGCSVDVERAKISGVVMPQGGTGGGGGGGGGGGTGGCKTGVGD